jgi:hypothetical protein
VPEAAQDKAFCLVTSDVETPNVLRVLRRAVRNKRILLICRTSQPGSWPYACGRCTVSVRA